MLLQYTQSISLLEFLDIVKYRHFLFLHWISFWYQTNQTTYTCRKRFFLNSFLEGQHSSHSVCVHVMPCDEMVFHLMFLDAPTSWPRKSGYWRWKNVMWITYVMSIYMCLINWGETIRILGFPYMGHILPIIHMYSCVQKFAHPSGQSDEAYKVCFTW